VIVPALMLVLNLELPLAADIVSGVASAGQALRAAKTYAESGPLDPRLTWKSQ